ncbi:MAG: phosphate ABC transporter permease PstA [Acidimicrobiia bacterium]
MTAIGMPAHSITASSATPWRRVKSGIATTAMGLSLLVAVVPLVLIIVYVVSRGWGVVTTSGWFTGSIPVITRSTDVGMRPAIIGTLMITGAATLMAVPLGVLGGVYLNEYAGGTAVGRVIRFLAEVMTGVPSVVMGLFVFAIWVLTFGYSAFAGALALGCLMLPVVIRTSEEMLRLVPRELRESAYALGGRKAGTIVRVVLPAAAPGIISGALLAVARAAGETAPLLFTIGFVYETNTSLFSGDNTALPFQIFKNAKEVFPGPQARAWGAALTLIGIVFIFTILSRIGASLLGRKHHQ